MFFRFVIPLALIFASVIYADELVVDPPKVWEADCFPCGPLLPCPACDPLLATQIDNCITVDLKNPLFQDGILSTNEGGVLCAPNLRVQARCIQYTRRLPDTLCIYCEGDLLIDYEGHTLTGQCLYFDFLTNTGMLLDGKAGAHPWYIGGKEIFFHPDGEIVVRKGYITTSEGEVKEVLASSHTLLINKYNVLHAHNNLIKVKGIPLFWVPMMKLNLNAIRNLPLATQFGWGGFLGTHLGLRYRFLQLGDFKGYARLDGYLGRGLGFGLEGEYVPKCSPTTLFVQNYWAHDLSIVTREKRDRYRFAGTFYDRLFNDTTSLNITYDKVSDGQFASQYRTNDFNLKTAGKTQLDLRRQEEFWIANLYAEVKVNSFQSINQQLPTFALNFHPFELGWGVIAENFVEASYLNYSFSDRVSPGRDFHSARFAVRPRIYRPFWLGPLTITPEAGFIGIAYSESVNDGGSAGQALANIGVRAETAFSKRYGRVKHSIEPYMAYSYLSNPSVNVNRILIFTINDGNTRISQLRFGVRNSFFGLCCDRALYTNLWANAFFDPISDIQTIPRGYFDLEWMPLARLFVAFNLGWNFEQNQRDFLNTRAEITFSENLAGSVEYRSRHKYDWRKANFYNFLLDVTRDVNALEDSPLSEERDLILGRVSYRVTPETVLGLELRNGWNISNEIESHFFEYKLDFETLIFDHWRLTFSYEKRVNDNRYTFNFLLAP